MTLLKNDWICESVTAPGTLDALYQRERQPIDLVAVQRLGSAQHMNALGRERLPECATERIDKSLEHRPALDDLAPRRRRSLDVVSAELLAIEICDPLVNPRRDSPAPSPVGHARSSGALARGHDPYRRCASGFNGSVDDPRTFSRAASSPLASRPPYA
jgi:hypothetical protein